MRLKRLQEVLEKVLYNYGDVDVTILDASDKRDTLSINCASVWKVETKEKLKNVLVLTVIDPRH